ncbi:MAG: DUF308 domain-containing protein [Methanomassiliicoccus sp.]|nr:DUF308 domain-containing protein [Methanomassiliicoccus sp.]
MAKEGMSRIWWGRTAFGIIALIFGLAFIFVPGITLTIFLIIFGIFMLVAGFILLGFSRSRKIGTHRTLNLVEGVLDIIIGLAAIFLPGVTAVAAVYIVGIFAIIAGILQIAEGAIAPRRTQTFGTSNRWLLVLSGAWALIIGILLVIYPGTGILALLILVGIFLVILGIINILGGLRMRSAGSPATVRE